MINNTVKNIHEVRLNNYASALKSTVLNIRQQVKALIIFKYAYEYLFVYTVAGK